MCVFKFSIVAVTPLVLLSISQKAIAQIIPDGSLGTESSIVVPLDGLSDRIDGGAIRGGNLFHSFGEFNIDAGRGAFFSNPTAVENILTRVTGGNPSNIFGTLGVLGEANLFLVNPNGIVFGPNAQLDVGGSFLASTAEGLLFRDGYEFSATNPDAPPLLTVNVPIGLQFGANPGEIEVRGMGLNRPPVPEMETLQESNDREVNFQQSLLSNPNGLGLESGRTLALVGGEITLLGGLLKAPAGRIELGSVAGETSLGLRATETGFALDYAGVQNFQNIQLSGEAAVFASGEGAGEIHVQGRNVTLTEGSEIVTDTLRSEAGQTLTVQASEVLELSGQNSDGTSPTRLSANTFGIGSGAEIIVETGQLILREGAELGTLAGSEGDGGDVTIRASELVELSGTSSLGAATSVGVATFGAGDSGGLTIETGQFIVRDGASVIVGTLGQGNGGTLTIDAAELVELTNSGSLSVFTAGSGNGGDINIFTEGSISINGGSVLVRTLGEGQGGSLRVNASESIQLIAENSNLLATTAGNGDAGEIRITTGQLIVRDGASIRVDTVGEGRGQGGQLTVNASESVELIDSGRLEALSANSSDGGEIDISTDRLIVRDGGEIFVVSTDEGRAGSLRIDASELVLLDGVSSSGDGSRLRASTVGSGAGGEIEITTERLIVRDGALVSVATFGEGDGGTLTVNASESVELEGLNSGLSGRTSSSGNGGAVTITTGQLIVRDGASVSVNTSGQGDGGTLTVNASESVELLGTVFIGESSVVDVGSNLSALTSDAGDGGEITITTGQFIVRDGASIVVATLEDSQGNGGKLTVNASESVELRGISSGGNSSNLGAITSGMGNAGEIEIDTGRLIVLDGASILVGTLQESQGNGGKLTVNASESVEVSGIAILNVDDLPTELAEQQGLEPASTLEFESFLSAGSFGSGDGGEVNIATERLIVRDGALISATTTGEGRGGRLTIAASESVELSGFSPSGESTSSLLTGTSDSGDAGDIEISTQQLRVRDGANVFLSTMGGGRGGRLTIDAESIELRGTAPDESSSSLSAFATETGDAGEIAIFTDRLLLRNGADISVFSSGEGDGGTIAIDASESVELSGFSAQNSRSTVSASAFRTGDAGEISISTPQLSVREGGNVQVFTTGTGRGGLLTVNASESVELSGVSPDGFASRFFAGTRDEGDGGNIFVETGQLRVADGATISVNSSLPTPDELQAFQEAGIEISGNLGNPGSIEIAADDLRLENEGFLNATSSTGRGGNIAVRGRDIRLREGLITASGSGSDPTLEGNIDLNAETLVLLDNSRITTSSADPQGGSNIAIRPLDGESVVVLVSPDSLINAQGELIVEGEIEPDPAEVPDIETTDVTSLISQGCQDYEGSEFYITGRGGLPPNPREILPGSSLVELDWVEDETESAIESSQRRDRPLIQTSTEHPPLIEAQGWIADEAGNIILTAEPYRGTLHPLALQHLECQDGDRLREVRSHGRRETGTR